MATDNQDQRSIWDLSTNLASCWGPTSVDIAAPGTAIASVGFVPGGGCGGIGTSASAPFVAGVAGLVLSESPELTFADARARILSTARQVAPLAGLCVTGGVVDANAALGGLRWVNFAFGQAGNGTIDTPWSSFPNAVNSVPVGGVLRIHAGSLAGAYTVNKAMRIKTNGGLVRIGAN
jgi:subtilisin family serine protease